MPDDINPYPPEEPGLRFRWLKYPTAPPEAPAERNRGKAQRQSGGECDVMATFGVGPIPEVNPLDDNAPGWEPL